MAITQRTWRLSNSIIFSIIATLVFFSSGCVSSSSSKVDSIESTPTATVTPEIIKTRFTYEKQESIQKESKMSTSTPGVKNNLEMVIAVDEPENPDFFVPLLDFPSPEQENRAIESSYRFGSTLFGERIPHDGVEILNGLGTPVLAAADGIVYFSGNDLSKKWGRYTNFYGNFIILEHNFQEYQEPIFTLYAHLSEILVKEGQQISKGQIIGKVGASGKAFTNHLHFEVRIGDVLLQNARNPELFLPLNKETTADVGILIGSLLSTTGNPIPGGSIVIQEIVDGIPQPGSIIYVETYAKGISGDEKWEENFVVSDLPVGEYRVTSYAYQHLLEEFIKIKPNEITIIKLQPEG